MDSVTDKTKNRNELTLVQLQEERSTLASLKRYGAISRLIIFGVLTMRYDSSLLLVRFFAILPLHIYKHCIQIRASILLQNSNNPTSRMQNTLIIRHLVLPYTNLRFSVRNNNLGIPVPSPMDLKVVSIPSGKRSLGLWSYCLANPTRWEQVEPSLLTLQLEKAAPRTPAQVGAEKSSCLVP